MRARHLLAMFDDMSRTAALMKDGDDAVRYIVLSLRSDCRYSDMHIITCVYGITEVVWDGIESREIIQLTGGRACLG